jgi:hypothetical protein
MRNQEQATVPGGFAPGVHEAKGASLKAHRKGASAAAARERKGEGMGWIIVPPQCATTARGCMIRGSSCDRRRFCQEL